MAGSRALRNRIRSTKNIRQMTKAMEAVSAVKMRRSQMLALNARPYALSALSLLRSIQKSALETGEVSPLMEQREINVRGLVVITSDKGLAGSFNQNVIKRAEQVIAKSDKKTLLITVGKKGRDYFRRRHASITQEFLGAGDYGALDETRLISDAIIHYFMSRECDEVVIVYTNFLSALKQEVVVRTLLPFTEHTLNEILAGIEPLRGKYANIPASFETADTSAEELIFEPSPTQALSVILPQLLAVQVFHAILEGNASEHSSRMFAMKNASDSAGELVEKLNIQYNKTRQAAITKELTEITAGKEALSN